MRASQAKQGTWVRYNGTASVRHGMIGTVERSAYTEPRYIPVYFPETGQKWQCHVKFLEPATQEEIAITAAKEAMGAFKKTRWRDVPVPDMTADTFNEFREMWRDHMDNGKP